MDARRYQREVARIMQNELWSEGTALQTIEIAANEAFWEAPSEDRLSVLLEDMVLELALLSEEHGISMNTILSRSLERLKKRYGNEGSNCRKSSFLSARSG